MTFPDAVARRVLAVALFSVALAACGRGEDSGETCPELNGEPCTEHGLPDENKAAFCDPCGKLWMCTYRTGGTDVREYYIAHTGHPCYCIVDGYNTCGTRWE